jgi:anti-sigma factor RsiW
MSETTREVPEADLLAYVDGRLPPTEREAVEHYLAAHPDKAAEVANWQRQNEALLALFAPAGNEPVPARLRPANIVRGRAANSNFRWTQVAAAVALVALGGAIGWAGRDIVTPTEAASDVLIQSAVTAHSLYVMENRHAVEVAATDREHLVSWLSNRVTQPINPPDLSAEGFGFIGGRLLPPAEYGKTGPAAQLMYENGASERVTVYITSALPDRATAYEFTSRGPHEAFYWANDKITCTVVGELAEAEMQTVAKKVYQQLTRRPDGTSAPMNYQGRGE